jgi:hypothetical protein
MPTKTGFFMQVIGITRFSYPAWGGFQITHPDPQTRAEFLYQPDRLDERFRLFESITLASLRAQSDPDFTLIVLVGEDFPQMDRLRALLDDLPQAVLRIEPPGIHRHVMKRVINEARAGHDDHCIQFRMDDDDGVGRHFVRRVRKIAEECLPLIERNRLTAIDFTRGHLAQPCAQGLIAEPIAKLYWVPALAVVARMDEPLTIMNFNHVKLWQFMPTITIATPDMYVRGIGGWNDSGLQSRASARLLDAAGEQFFRDAYGIDADRVRALYAARR